MAGQQDVVILPDPSANSCKMILVAALPSGNPKKPLLLLKYVLPHHAITSVAATWELGKAAPGFSPFV
jgi:hypothetical protein